MGVEQKLKESTAPQLTGWVYWLRDPVRSPDCWTKVFAVVDHAFLWIFQRKESAPQSLLVQVAVGKVFRDEGRVLRVIDPSGEELCLCLYDDVALERWTERLSEAASLTAAFFRTSKLEVGDLPRWSNYRGTLEDYNRVSKRTRCKDAVAQLIRRWKKHVEE
ncbi:hypothetical protein V7S43_013763 [Phytophthora oleae]|uniref:PH domain-containing protein n=1 Tax=Phytophthora oleae TaxID=2107226 RepID=A0ABD3F4G2_9STRA